MNQLKVSLQEAIVGLFERGWSQRRIARELRVDRETVKRYISAAKPVISTTGSTSEATTEPAISTAGSATGTLADPAISTTGSKAAKEVKPAIPTAGSPAGRVSLCREFLPQIIAALGAGLSAQRIHQDLVSDHGFTGSYESVKRCVRSLSAQMQLPVRRMESAPGEQMQVDFGQGAWVIDETGKRRRPHLFRAVLSHSRKGYSEVVWRQDTETFIRCVENAFRHFGGVTRTTVVDNLKAAVLEVDWFDPELNPKMRDFAKHYGTVVLPTQPARPEHKGKIEAGVKYVQNNALKGRTFPSLAAQNTHLADWERSVADTRIHGTVRQQVGALFALERPALQALPDSLFPSFVEARRKVHRDGHIEFDRAYYSVPPEYFGREVWVRAEARMVRVFNLRMEVITAHARVEPGRFATADAHIHAHKRSGIERGADYWLGRCRQIGPHSTAWAQAVFKQRDLLGLRTLQGLVSMTKEHPVAALEHAAERAVHRGLWRLKDLRHLLGTTDNLIQIDFLDTHPLIRDMDAYKLDAFTQA